MLTGDDFPFQSTNESIDDAIRYGEIKPKPTFVSQEAWQLVLRMLAKKAEDRISL